MTDKGRLVESKKELKSLPAFNELDVDAAPVESTKELK